MYLSDVLHACTAHIYKDFSNQQTSQKILKVVLPIIALLAIGLALRRCLFPNQPLPKQVQKAQPDEEKTPPAAASTPPSAGKNTSAPPSPSTAPSTQSRPAAAPGKAAIFAFQYEALPEDEETPEADEPKSQLVDLVPKTLYNGVCCGDVNLVGLEQQSHRWNNPTNLETLVRLSTEKAYPANHLKFPKSHKSYIMAESPLNSEFVNWQADFYRMAIEKDVGLLLCTSRALILGSRGQNPYFSLPTFNFLLPGNDLKIDDWTIKCDYFGSTRTQTNTYFTIHRLTISHRRLPEKIIWEFFPAEGFASIRSIPGVIDKLNDFIKENRIALDETHPLLVTCETGFNSSASFILFHELQARIEVFTREHAGLGKEKIYQAFMAGRSILEMLKELAFEIQELSTSKAAIDEVKGSVQFEISHMTYGEKPYKDFILEVIGIVLQKF